MWETILKAVNVPSPDTDIEEIKELMRQAIRLPNLESQITTIKGAASNKIRPIRKEIESINNQIKGIKEANKNKSGEGVKSLEKEIKELQALNIPLREQIVKIEKTAENRFKALEELYKENSKNPFVPIITRRATYSQNAIFSKRGVKAEKITPTPSIPLADSYSILDDGYGNEQFYGKAIPLTLQEAAEHYKENVINVESEKFRQFETVAFREGGGRTKPEKSGLAMQRRELLEDKTYAEPKPPRVLESTEEGKKLRAKETRDKNKRARNFKPSEPEPKVKKLPKTRMFTDDSSDIGSDFKTLSSIRTILQPKSTAEINDIVIGLDSFFEGKDSPNIDKFKQEEPEKFQEIIDLVESISNPMSDTPMEDYLRKILSLVQVKKVKQKSGETNDVQYIIFDTGNELRVENGGRYANTKARLTLPFDMETSDETYDIISQWLTVNYLPLPEVSNKSSFIRRLITNIFDTTESANSLPFAIERITKNTEFISKLKKLIPSKGVFLTLKEQQSIFTEYINKKMYKDVNLLSNVKTYLREYDTISNILTPPQIEKMDKLLETQIGNDVLESYFLRDTAKWVKPTKDKKSLASKLGIKPNKKVGEKSPKGGRDFSSTTITEDGPTPYPKLSSRYKQKLNLPKDGNYKAEYSDYEITEAGKLTQYQKERLSSIKESFIGPMPLGEKRREGKTIRTPRNQKTVDEQVERKKQAQKDYEQMSPEEKAENIKSQVKLYSEIARKNDGRISYEPYTGRKRQFLISQSKGRLFEESIKENLESNLDPFTGFYRKVGPSGMPVQKADLSSLPSKERRKVKAMLQNAHPTEYFGEDYLRLGKVINIIDGLAEDEEAELLEKLGVKNLQMVKTAASLRKKYENLYEKLYNMVYDEEE